MFLLGWFSCRPRFVNYGPKKTSGFSGRSRSPFCQQLDAAAQRILHLPVFVCSDTHPLLNSSNFSDWEQSAWLPRFICIGLQLVTTGYVLATTTRSSVAKVGSTVCTPTAWICQLIRGSAIAMPSLSLVLVWVAFLILGRNRQHRTSLKAFAQKRQQSQRAGVGAQ